MKKKFWILMAVAVLLVAALILLIVGLNKSPETDPTPTEDNRTLLFLPETFVTYSRGVHRGDFTLQYDENWQNADSFKVEYVPTENNIEKEIPWLTYSDNFMITVVPDVSYTETSYDEKGNVIREITTYYANGAMESVERQYSYDDYGRLLTVMNCTIFRGNPNASINYEGYEYTDTETGSEASFEHFGKTYKMVYDKDYNLICRYMYLMDQEASRTEYTYDEYGNLLTAVTYLSGDQIDYEERYTYKAVEVSQELVDRWVQFNSNQ